MIKPLIQHFGPEQVLTDPAALAAAAHDALHRSRGSAAGIGRPAIPLAILRPRDTEDVVWAVRFAAEKRLPIVELGGGTGLMGGARSVEPGLVLDLGSLNRVVEISVEDRTARVQAGVVLEDLNRALGEQGLMLGHDPWTLPVATVGGTISTNSLGYRGAQYGSMGDQVLGLEVVLGDGAVIRTTPAARSSVGPQLKRLFIGAEGTLGVIIEAVLRVFPLPEARRLHALEFPDFDSGFHAIETCFAAGVVPAMVDFGQTYDGPRDGREPFTPAGAHGRLQLAFEGFHEGVEATSGRAITLCREHAGRLLPEAEAEAFWEDRHVVAERFRRRRPVESDEASENWLPAGVRFDFVHVALPASRVLAYRDRAAALMLARGVSVVEWGLWNQPELFSAVVKRHVENAEEAEAFAAAVDELLSLAQDLGGSMEYCHGAGLRLAPLMRREHGHGLDLLRAIKRQVDPQGILNPGKLDLGSVRREA